MRVHIINCDINLASYGLLGNNNHVLLIKRTEQNRTPSIRTRAIHNTTQHTQSNICRSYCYEKWGRKNVVAASLYSQKVNARNFFNKCNVMACHGMAMYYCTFAHTRTRGYLRFRCRWFTMNWEAKRCLISQTNDKRQVQFRKLQLRQFEHQVKGKRLKELKSLCSSYNTKSFFPESNYQIENWKLNELESQVQKTILICICYLRSNNISIETKIECNVNEKIALLEMRSMCLPNDNTPLMRCTRSNALHFSCKSCITLIFSTTTTWAFSMNIVDSILWLDKNGHIALCCFERNIKE